MWEWERREECKKEGNDGESFLRLFQKLFQAFPGYSRLFQVIPEAIPGYSSPQNVDQIIHRTIYFTKIFSAFELKIFER